MSSLSSIVRTTVTVVLFAGLAVPVQAVLLEHNQVITPYILAGAPPDSLAARVDANTPGSPFSGVVSINIRYDGQSFICSGVLVGTRKVISAGHCVDTDGQGHVIDVSQSFAVSGKDVRVVFNAESTGPGAAVVTASAVSMHPDYKGFGICPAGVPGFCVQDDISVITLSQDAPASAKIYKLKATPIASGQQIILAGYGTSGNGIAGFTTGPAFRVKRTGQNVVDIFEGNDEAFTGFDPNGFVLGAPNELFYADFDGVDSSGVNRDSNCAFFGVCTLQLPNHLETNFGLGDSGAPSFVDLDGELVLVATITHGASGFSEENPGAFGSLFGGIVLGSYIPYLLDATEGALQLVVPALIPEPGSLAILGLGIFVLAATRSSRRRQARLPARSRIIPASVRRP